LGAHVPDLAGSDLTGNPIKISYSGSREDTVLLVLQPLCRWCERNMPALRDLVRRAHGYRFVIVSTSDQKLEPFLRRFDMTLPTVARLSPESIVVAGFTSIPSTVVVGPDGVVRKVWIGSFGPIERLQVEHFFGVSLGG
jgi:peroxiredoxin